MNKRELVCCGTVSVLALHVEYGVSIVQPLTRVSYEQPGGSNVSLLIVRSMGTYANVTVHFQASQFCSANSSCNICTALSYLRTVILLFNILLKYHLKCFTLQTSFNKFIAKTLSAPPA